MPVKEKIVSFRVHKDDWVAFESFIRRADLKPYEFLRTIVEMYAASEHLASLISENEIDKLDAIAELGRIIEKGRTYFRLNGAFNEALRTASQYYGLDLGL